jgi:hypothetical protein
VKPIEEQGTYEFNAVMDYFGENSPQEAFDRRSLRGAMI